MTTAQKMKFSFKDFFSKCDQSRSFLRIWSHLLKKSLMKNFIFCAVFQLFKDSFNLEYLVNIPTFFKRSPSWTDLVIASTKVDFKKKCILETRISDFHKLTAVSLNSQILKVPLKWNSCIDYKAFDKNSFNNDLNQN